MKTEEKEFTPNPEYIELIKRSSDLSKADPNGITLKTMKRRLLKMELAMPTRDIILNTRLAHPVKEKEANK
jgi:hypothetical protein